MVNLKQSEIPVCNILCKGKRIKQVGTFIYLGFTITPDARCDTEIKKRIALSKYTFSKMKSIFTNRNIRIYTKINTLEAYIWSVRLHGCECWTLTKDLRRRLEAAEMRYIRRRMRITWTEKKSNEEVMEMAGHKKSLLKTICKRQLQVFGHINRADGLEKQYWVERFVVPKAEEDNAQNTDSLNSSVTRKESPN